MIYLGTFGRMAGIKCPSSQSVETTSRHTFDQTIEGNVKAQVRRVGRRSWSVQLGQATTPQDHSTLAQFASGVWGKGPFWFIPTDALVSNALTPESSTCATLPSNASPSISIAGPVQLPDGQWAAKSYISSNTAANMWFGEGIQAIPVTPGQVVTASAHVMGAGCRVYLYFTDSSGSEISRVPSGAVGVASELRRLSSSGVVPAGAVAAGMYSIGTSRGAAAAFSFTAEVQPWAEGQGCSKAVVSEFSRSQVLAIAGSTFSSVNCTIKEVG